MSIFGVALLSQIALMKFAEARLVDTDRQAHFVVGFQASMLLERGFELKGYSRGTSVLLANGIILAGALVKESLLDTSFSGPDVLAGMGGAAVGTLVFLMLDKDRYQLESEGGLFQYTPDRGGAGSPPESLFFKAQNTIWVNRLLGFHQFAGGADNGKKDDSGKRLTYGGGLRFGLTPGTKLPRKSFISTWVGIDYGRLLFATPSQNVGYLKEASTIFYSVGGRLKFAEFSHLAVEGQFVPYRSNPIWAFGASLGFIR